MERNKQPLHESISKLRILRTFEPKNFEKLRTAQPKPKFTGSYQKKRVEYWYFNFCLVKMLIMLELAGLLKRFRSITKLYT